MPCRHLRRIKAGSGAGMFAGFMRDGRELGIGNGEWGIGYKKRRTIRYGLSAVFIEVSLWCGEAAGLFQGFAIHLLFAHVANNVLGVQGVLDALHGLVVVDDLCQLLETASLAQCSRIADWWVAFPLVPSGYCVLGHQECCCNFTLRELSGSPWRPSSA